MSDQLYQWDDSEYGGINLPIESVGKGAYATFHDALVGIGVLVPVEPPDDRGDWFPAWVRFDDAQVDRHDIRYMVWVSE